MQALNMMCPINQTGYGTTSKNIVKSLAKMQVEISLFGIGDLTVDSEEEQKQIAPLINNSYFYVNNAPTLKIWHQHDLGVRPGNGTYYALPFFELDRFQNFEKHQLNSVDHLFTPSNWSKNVLIDNGINTPITICPLGIDPTIFHKPNNQEIQFTENNYVFIHVGKWEVRKGQDFLIEAFSNAFTEADNVELWLVPHNPFLNQEETQAWYSIIQDSPLKDKIKVIDRLPNQNLLAEVMNRASCGIFMSRAEGWNNEIPEMMALDKPIITTNYSAHTEYCNSDNSLLVEINETETAHDGKFFMGQGNWARLGEAQMEQTIEYMRFVYNKEVKSNPAGLETAKKYTWDRTASIIRETIFN